MHLSAKQYQALTYLQDDITNELLYGGGAGGGKSVLGCYWVLKMCFKYPGTRYLIGRSILKTLKETTIKTLFEVIEMQQIPVNSYRYNAQTNEIIFKNKSEIIFKDLFSYPSDPNFDELGSLEITGAFIDETIQVKEKAKNIVKSRIRYKIDEYNLIPKMLYTSNPGKGWLYNDFYRPFVENKLPENKQFVQSLLPDNPYISSYYAENLQSLDKESKERLLNGNWDYEAEGYLYNENQLNYFDLKDIDISTGIIIDYADIADTGLDYFSKPMACIINQNVYVFDWIYTQKPSEYWMKLDIDRIRKYNPIISFYESNNAGLMATKLIKQKIGKPYSDIIRAVKESQNKHERMKLSAEIDIIPNFYFLMNPEGQYKLAMEHLFQYRYDKTFKIDDAPDSLAGLSKVTKAYRDKKNRN